MYSFLFSTIEQGFIFVESMLKDLINNKSRIIILPWSFPKEITGDELENNYFKVGERRYNKYVSKLYSLGISDENIEIGNCYMDDSNDLIKKIEKSDIIILTGGNPEMLTRKIKEKSLEKCLEEYKGIIIGESAGACIQFKNYFLTEENNFPRGYKDCKGVNILRTDFIIDVHTNRYVSNENSNNNDKYINSLKQITKKYKKCILAISDDGVVVVNRKNNQYKLFGKVDFINKVE